LSDLGNKMPMTFCDFLWDLMWVQIFCAMDIATCTCQIIIRSYLFMCFLLVQVLWQIWIINAFIFLQNCFFLSCCFLNLWILDALNKSSTWLNLMNYETTLSIMYELLCEFLKTSFLWTFDYKSLLCNLD
jgi:hypothetical protein